MLLKGLQVLWSRHKLHKEEMVFLHNSECYFTWHSASIACAVVITVNSLSWGFDSKYLILLFNINRKSPYELHQSIFRLPTHLNINVSQRSEFRYIQKVIEFQKFPYYFQKSPHLQAMKSSSVGVKSHAQQRIKIYGHTTMIGTRAG